VSDVIAVQGNSDRLAVASQWQLTWWAFKRHRLAMIGLWIVAFFYLIAIIPGFFAMNDPSRQNARAAFHPPQSIHWIDRAADGSWSLRPHVYATQLKRDPVSLAPIFSEDPSKKIYLTFFGNGYDYSFYGLATLSTHVLATATPGQQVYLLGTDRLGRCVWSRIMQGTQISLSVGLVGVLLSLLLGIVLGGISGYYGGRLDFVIQRVIEFVLSLPTIPIWLALAAAVPQDWPAVLNYFTITLILSLTGWAQLAVSCAAGS
jgi:peptide/nickel transport system permease protein